MDKKIIIKYFDIILLADKKDSFFSIGQILIPKYFKYDTPEEREFFQELRRELKEFSEFHEYFEWLPNGSCRLRKKGLAAKDKNGHVKYLKHINKPPKSEIWYNQNWVGFLLAFIVFLFSVYQFFENRTLKSRVESLTSDNKNYKDSLTEYRLLLEKQEQSTKKDTLSTSYRSDSNN
ncbi:hypothetical protein [Flavisericum labens]|uniref:hypothetical protein n=1 Tax=Flavisericum labens TaxID=3377112 RepID=UPI00387B5A64